MGAIAFFLLLIVFSFYGVASAVLVYHFQNYRMDKAHHQWLMTLFIAGSILLVSVEIALFRAVDWEAVQALLPSAGQTLSP